MLSHLSQVLACHSTINPVLEYRLITSYRAVYPLVLFDRIHEYNILRIESVFWIHSLGENVGELEWLEFFFVVVSIGKVWFSASFFVNLQKKRRLGTAVSDPVSSLFSYLSQHTRKYSIYKKLSISVVYVSNFSIWYSDKKTSKF